MLEARATLREYLELQAKFDFTHCISVDASRQVVAEEPPGQGKELVLSAAVFLNSGEVMGGRLYEREGKLDNYWGEM